MEASSAQRIFSIHDICVAISYLKANKTADTQFEIDDTVPFSVSGNNIDGFIITEWRKDHDG